jgi:hypothetical protein
MSVKKFFLVVLSVFVLQCCPISVLAIENYVSPNEIVYSRLEKEKLVPAKLMQNLAVKTVKKGDVVNFKLIGNVESDKKIIVPAQSILEGKVVNLRKALWFRADAYVDVLVTSVKNNSGSQNIENKKVVLRIADYHYKSFWRRTLQRTPVVLCGVATSITLSQATNMNAVSYGSIAFGVGTLVGFISGLIDPDIDRTRWNGAVLRGIEGSPYGTLIITVQRGYGLNFKADDVILIKFDEKTKQKFADNENKL